MSETSAETLPQVAKQRQGLPDLEEVGDRLSAAAHVSAIFGEPVRDGNCLIVPVAQATWGFGGGSGAGGAGSGAGGGLHVRPVGFVTVQDGRATFRRIGVPWLQLCGAALLGAAAASLLQRRKSKGG